MLVDPADLAGVAEIANELGVSRQAVSNWLTRGSAGFPAPVVVLASGPIYVLRDVVVWYTRRS